MEDGLLRFDAATTLPTRPLVGCLAVVPEEGTVHSKMQGAYGGNLDSREICAGATLVLPVFHPGAGLYFGDCKALVTDAEVVTAPECDAVVVASVDNRARPAAMRVAANRDRRRADHARFGPTAGMGNSRSVSRVAQLDGRRVATLPRSRAALLMGMVADTGTCQVSNTDYTAYCTIPRAILAPYTRVI